MTIPKEIIEAALKIDRWATEQGMERYEIGPICSRNFADDSQIVERAKLYCLARIANQRLNPDARYPAGSHGPMNDKRIRSKQETVCASHHPPSPS